MPRLIRALTTWDVVALGVNGVIGGGIFLAPSTVARHAGSWSIFVYLFSGVLMSLIALCFAEAGGRLGSRVDRSFTLRKRSAPSLDSRLDGSHG